MMNHLLAADAVWNWFALEVVLKGTLLLFLASGMVMRLSRSSAAVRHRVWSLLFVGLLLLPLVQLAVPGLTWQIVPHRWELGQSQLATATADVDFRPSQPDLLSATEYASPAPLPALVETDSPPAIQHSELIARESQSAVDEVTGTAFPAVEQTSDESGAGSSVQWIPLLWLLGMGVALAPLIVGIFGNFRLRRGSRPCADSEWLRMAAASSQHLGLRRNVTLLFGGPQQMPLTFGLFRPCVILPLSANDWSLQRRRIVLLHELAHVKRCDVALQLFARLATAIYWFHPLVWWALRQMRYEREQACDDCVLEAGQQAPDYATELLEIARAHHRSSPLLSAALSMARPSQLEGRLLAVLDLHRRRNGISRAAAIQLTAVALALVAGIGLVRPTLQAQATASTSNDNAEAIVDPSKPATEMILTGTVLSPQGKPVAAATVEVVTYDYNWRAGRQKESNFEHYHTRADGDGRFRLVLPRHISRPREYTQVIAARQGFASATQRIESTLTRQHVEVKLHEPKVVRLQLIDTAGNPLAKVQPQLWWAFGNDAELFIFNRGGRQAVSAWPRFSQSDAQGNVSVTLPQRAETLVLFVEDERLGDHLVRVEDLDRSTGVAIKPPQLLNGKVTAADSGDPVSGAEVVLMKEPYRRVRTGADGSFRFLSGASIGSPYPSGESRYIVCVFPPPESPYLAAAGEWQKPKDGFDDGELSVSLKRGIVVEGRVNEKRTQEPVAGATVHFEPQQANNPFFRESGPSRSIGSDMRYTTDANGRFRLAVSPGPGYLLVRGPTLDFIHVEVTTGDLHYGKPGLDRQYHHGALRINLEPDKPPQTVTIELERGVTLRRRVVRPDGQPAAGKAYARSYLLHQDDIHSWLPPLPLDDGVLEIPGFEPERSKPIFIFDPAGGCAATVSPAATEVDLDDPPIRLQRFGSAAFRFVNDTAKALADYEPMLILIVTPGATPSLIRPDQPLSSERIIWQNIVRPEQVLKTDSDGRVTVNNLIPGATYRVLYVGKEDWTDGYEFIVRSDETVDVGEVVIPQRD